MYDPSAFLISTAALTSIFSLSFSEYFLQRKGVYALWLEVFVYGFMEFSAKEVRRLCSDLESKERQFRRADGLLRVLLVTLIIEYIVFHCYSFKYVCADSPFYEPDAFHTYLWFSVIIGVIILINGLEILYIIFAVRRIKGFPFFKIRNKEGAHDRLSMIWQVIECSKLKLPEYNKARIPRKFYKDRDKTAGDGVP